MSEEAQVRRAVMFLESLIGKADHAGEGIFTDCLVEAFVAGKAAIEKHGYKLEVSAGGITWSRAQKKKEIA